MNNIEEGNRARQVRISFITFGQESHSTTSNLYVDAHDYIKSQLSSTKKYIGT